MLEKGLGQQVCYVLEMGGAPWVAVKRRFNPVQCEERFGYDS